ncbi:MAG: protein kinase [Aphanothece sp. CMT-3BRIN-NPC111]|jgi:serine/threonine-protein kinase|nr:protein kinase [Aphanothece sp. CMT-3BRIN-NPC111]
MNFIFCTHCGRQNPDGARFCSGCGSSLSEANTGPATALRPGTKLRDRYIILRLLGQGGFGRTYVAEDTGRFNELIAIKEFTPTAQGTFALLKAEELFQREAITLHRLQHPQIPRFWETFQHQKRLFLVEDYIEGETYQFLLNQRLEQGGAFSETEILQLFRQMLPVLSYLHRQGVIHRDISPDNIMRSAKIGLPVLIDLGGVKQAAINVATQVSSSQNPSSSGMGTRLGKVGYAPEEQLRMGIVAPHSDLYALGVTAVVLMTGQQPQELIDPYTMNWIWDRHLRLSPLLTGILNRMLAQDPYQRFQSAEEILQLLEPKATFIENNRGQGDFVVQPEPQQRLRPTSSGKRFLNCVLDSVFYLIFFIIFLFAIVLFIEANGVNTNVFDDNTWGIIGFINFYVSYFIYYMTEALFGKSIAKFITRTKVVNRKGKKPGFCRTIGRTVARLIPVDVFSFLFSSNPIGWHDLISGTRVVDDQR